MTRQPDARRRLPLALVAPVSVVALYAALVVSVLGWAAVQRVFATPPAVTVVEPVAPAPTLVELLGPVLSVPALLMVSAAAAVLGAGALWCVRRPSALRTGAVVSAAVVVPALLATVLVPVFSGQGAGSLDLFVSLLSVGLITVGLPVVLTMVAVLHQAGATVRHGGGYPVVPAG